MKVDRQLEMMLRADQKENVNISSIGHVAFERFERDMCISDGYVRLGIGPQSTHHHSYAWTAGQQSVRMSLRIGPAVSASPWRSEDRWTTERTDIWINAYAFRYKSGGPRSVMEIH